MVTENINIDVRPGGIPIVIHVTQYEVGLRKFVFTPYTSAGELTVVAGSATLEGTKPDGYAFQQACQMIDGVITYTLQEQLCAVEGRIWSRLVVRDASGGMIGYTAIVWVVGCAGVKDDAVMSDSDISALRQFLDEFGTIDAYRGALNGALAAVGGPLVASTAVAMTDRTKVYVYTGSESGYTEGHWYYWSGSAWTDGGVYQSTGINTDKTLTVEDMAADAKATGDAVAELKNDLQYNQNEFNDNFSLRLYGETVIVKSFVQGDRSSSDPYTTTQNLLRITVPYPITMRKGDKLTISCPTDKKIGVLTSTGYSSGLKTADYTITANANWDAFIIMANSDTSTTITPADGVAAGMTITYTDNTSRLTAVDTAITQLENNSGFFIDKSQISVPGYTVNNGRIYSSSSDTRRSEFIKVTAGTRVAYRLSGIASFNLISFYTDKSATSSSAPSYVSGVAGEAAGRYTQGVFTVPQDGYIVFTNMIAYEDIYIGNVDGLYEIDKRIDNLEQSTGVTDLTGRYILNFGDSLANGAGNNNKSYADMIADETGATLADYSVSGTPFANYGSSTGYACVRNQVRQAVSDHSAHDVAICFIEGGINDLKRNVLDLGTLSDNFDGTYTENMIIGSAENIFYSLKEAFPAAKIVFVMYHQMPLTTSAFTETQMHQRQDQEYNAFVAVCKKWAIPVADIYAEGGINSNIEAMANAYFGVDNSEKFGRDIAHPNALGYRKFYVPLIKQKIALSTYEHVS